MDTDRLDLCKLLIGEMLKLGFNSKSIECLSTNQLFLDSINKETTIQKNLLTVLLFKTLIYSNLVIPTSVRLSLNIATDNLGWIADLQLAVLPYMKEHESNFFPNT